MPTKIVLNQQRLILNSLDGKNEFPKAHFRVWETKIIPIELFIIQ